MTQSMQQAQFTQSPAHRNLVNHADDKGDNEGHHRVDDAENDAERHACEIDKASDFGEGFYISGGRIHSRF